MIEIYFAGPPTDQRAGVDVFNAADTRQGDLPHSLGVNQLRFGRRAVVFGNDVTLAIDTPVKAITLHRLTAGLADGVFQGSDRLLLGRLGSRHVKDFLL